VAAYIAIKGGFMEVKDITGKALKLGDVVVYPWQVSHRKGLRVGMVVGFEGDYGGHEEERVAVLIEKKNYRGDVLGMRKVYVRKGIDFLAFPARIPDGFLASLDKAGKIDAANLGDDDYAF